MKFSYPSTFIIPCSIFVIGLHVKNIKNNLALRGKGGHPPCIPPSKGTKNQRTKVPKNLLSCANRPYIVRIGLIVVVHVAIVQVHVPRVRRIVRVGSTRPVVVRLHADKGITFGPLARSPRV